MMSLLSSLLSLTSPFINAAVVTFSIQFIGFIIAAILQTEIFYDILGGINFLILASAAGGARSAVLLSLSADDISSLSSETLTATSTASTASTATTATSMMSILMENLNLIFIILFALSRGWLLLFLAWRAHDRKGDSRFDGVRNVPSRFFAFWMVQGLWVYCISTPLLLVVSSSSSSSSNSSINSSTNSWLNICLLLGMMKSIIVQITSDISKSIWVSRGRIGGFCTDGFWYISRHPNYTGEIFTWIFASLYSMSVNEFSITSIIVASISPLFTIHILCNTSATGVWNAEGKNLKRYYEHSNKDVRIQYNLYRMTTAPLYPNVIEFLIPYEQLPMSFKRWFYFEWERYEYKENKKK